MLANEMKELSKVSRNLNDGFNKQWDEMKARIKENAQKASYYANKTLRKVKKKVGFTEMPR